MDVVEQTVEATPAPEAMPVDSKAIRESKMFQSLAREKAKLEEQLAARDAASKAAEEKRLAEQGEYRTIAEQRAAEIETIKAQHARDLLTRDADLALVSAGLAHPALRKGYIADYLSLDERPTLDEWAAGIKADPLNAPLFSQPTAPPVGAGPNAGAAPRAGAGALDERLNSTDPAVRKAAQAEWMRKNMPGAQ